MCFASRRELEQLGFRGFVALSKVRSRLDEIPDSAGVYAVIDRRCRQLQLQLTARSLAGRYKGRAPTIPLRRLRLRLVRNACVVYFGKADGFSKRSCLPARINAYMRQGEGHQAGHWGGRAIWQIKDQSALQLAWLETSTGHASDIEKHLLAVFALVYGRVPFANH